MKIDEINEALSNCGTKEWNEALSSRLESVLGLLSQDAWVKGASVNLRAVQGNAMHKIMNENLSLEAYHYLRGFCKGLQYAISLPGSIEASIKNVNDKKKPESSERPAGY